MTDKKPLLEHQKQRLELAIDEISTPIFSTKTRNVSDNQRVSVLSDTYSAKSLPRFLPLDYMAAPEIPYTVPKLVKGKRVTTVPKGSTWVKEEAKQNWYVEFFFHNAETDKMECFRPSKNLNRLKDPKEKLKQFTRSCDAYKIALECRWSPIDENANDKLECEVSSLTLEAAKLLFEEYQKLNKSIKGYANYSAQYIRRYTLSL